MRRESTCRRSWTASSDVLDPSYWDWPVWAGNNQPRLFRVPEGEGWADLTGSRLVGWIRWSGGEILLDSAAPVTIDGLQYGLWLEDQTDTLWRGFFGARLTLAQSRMLPAEPAWREPGRACSTSRALPIGIERARYEIERRLEAEQSTLFAGQIIATSWGLNTDV
jgi:hypothetical protein